MSILGFDIISWLIGIEFVVIMASTAKENTWAALVSIIFFGFIMHWVSDISLIEFFKANSTYVIQTILTYLVIGILWGFVKWFFYVKKIKEEYLEFTKNNKRSKTDILMKFGDIPPKASSNKEKIINWISLWPFNILWTLVSDFLTNLFNAIYKSFSGIFQKISDNQFNEILKEKNLKQDTEV